MKFFAAAIAFLPLAAFANPVPNDFLITDISVLRQREAERLGLATRDILCYNFVKVPSKRQRVLQLLREPHVY